MLYDSMCTKFKNRQTNDARHENRDYLEGVGSFGEEGILGRRNPGG